MHRNIVRKSLGLLFTYIVIIVGIFMLQFRSDSVISERIGNLRISLAETKGEGGKIDALAASMYGTHLKLQEDALKISDEARKKARKEAGR